MTSTQKISRLAFALLMSLLCTSLAQAQAIREAHVFSEQDDADNDKCSIRNEGTRAAVETALRQNRIGITPLSPGKLNVYVVLTVLELNQQNCAASLRIQFMKYGDVVIDDTRKRGFGVHELCARSGIYVLGKSRLATRVNDAARNLTEQCISSIEKEYN